MTDADPHRAPISNSEMYQTGSFNRSLVSTVGNGPDPARSVPSQWKQGLGETWKKKPLILECFKLELHNILFAAGVSEGPFRKPDQLFLHTKLIHSTKIQFRDDRKRLAPTNTTYLHTAHIFIIIKTYSECIKRQNKAEARFHFSTLSEEELLTLMSNMDMLRKEYSDLLRKRAGTCSQRHASELCVNAVSVLSDLEWSCEVLWFILSSSLCPMTSFETTGTNTKPSAAATRRRQAWPVSFILRKSRGDGLGFVKGLLDGVLSETLCLIHFSSTQTKTLPK